MGCSWKAADTEWNTRSVIEGINLQGSAQLNRRAPLVLYYTLNLLKKFLGDAAYTTRKNYENITKVAAIPRWHFAMDGYLVTCEFQAEFNMSPFVFFFRRHFYSFAIVPNSDNPFVQIFCFVLSERITLGPSPNWHNVVLWN